MITKNDSRSSMPQSWGDIYKSEEPLDFSSFLQSDVLAKKRQSTKVVAIIRHILGPLSILSSGIIMWHILHSHLGLSTTYNRLVFGLCCADIIASLAHSLSTSAIPKEMNYFIPYARGNVSTCEAQGFFFYLGFQCASMYNCAICFYYLAIIKYNKTDEFIKRKLEPWFHISIVVPFVTSVTFLFLKAFNTMHTVCFHTTNQPPHCIGREEGYLVEGFSIPCGRGAQNKGGVLSSLNILAHSMVLGLPPAVIICTMSMMYISVWKVERKMTKYGVGALRKNVGKSVFKKSSLTNQNNQVQIPMFKRLRKRIVPCSKSKDRPKLRSSQAKRSRKRSIFNVAFGYSLAWFFTHGETNNIKYLEMCAGRKILY